MILELENVYSQSHNISTKCVEFDLGVWMLLGLQSGWHEDMVDSVNHNLQVYII